MAMFESKSELGPQSPPPPYSATTATVQLSSSLQYDEARRQCKHTVVGMDGLSTKTGESAQNNEKFNCQCQRNRKETEELNLQKSKDDIAMKGAKCKWEAKKGDLKRKWEKKKGDLKRKWERAKDNMRLKWAMKTRENKTRPYVPLNDNIKRDGGRRSSNIPLRDNIEPRRDMRHTHVPSREEANATAIAAIATFTLFGMLLMS
ncbi:hypothetical protein O988_01219 [Pseudogymnoascus sp. VKM F-3808]|nr:hypothetical protein O988_01219 [Pseudogymnoascus sp. VKM F-3808]